MWPSSPSRSFPTSSPDWSASSTWRRLLRSGSRSSASAHTSPCAPPGRPRSASTWRRSAAWRSCWRRWALTGSTAIRHYVYHYLHAPKAVSTRTTGPARASLTLGTTPAAGSLGGSKSWVSYLVRQNGKWGHTTVFTVPAHSLVHVTIYNFDGASGLRNPFLSQVQGTVGGTMRITGPSAPAKPTDVINPDD